MLKCIVIDVAVEMLSTNTGVGGVTTMRLTPNEVAPKYEALPLHVGRRSARITDKSLWHVTAHGSTQLTQMALKVPQRFTVHDALPQVAV